MAFDRVRLVTVSASYGAGGSVVAPGPGGPAWRPLPAAGNDQRRRHRSRRAVCRAADAGRGAPTPVHWLIACLTSAMPTGPTQSPPPTSIRTRTSAATAKRGIRDLAEADAGVILGRGAAVVGSARAAGSTCDSTGRQDSASFRAPQSRASAKTRPAVTWTQPTGPATPTCAACTGPIPADPRHYHLVIDSTALPLGHRHRDHPERAVLRSTQLAEREASQHPGKSGLPPVTGRRRRRAGRRARLVTPGMSVPACVNGGA